MEREANLVPSANPCSLNYCVCMRSLLLWSPCAICRWGIRWWSVGRRLGVFAVGHWSWLAGSWRLRVIIWIFIELSNGFIYWIGALEIYVSSQGPAPSGTIVSLPPKTWTPSPRQRREQRWWTSRCHLWKVPLSGSSSDMQVSADSRCLAVFMLRSTVVWGKYWANMTRGV